jgi:hypothetical protein
LVKHQQIIQLAIAYALAGIFIATACATFLSLFGWVKFQNQKQQKRLFTVLIVELAIVGIGFFNGFLRFNYSEVADTLVKQGEAIERLRKENAARLLTHEQRQKIKAGLADATPPEHVMIYGISGDREAFQFALLLQALLREAGWTNIDVQQEIFLGGVPPGLLFRYASNSVSGPIIVKAFQNAGLTNGVAVINDLGPHKVEISVGIRP